MLLESQMKDTHFCRRFDSRDLTSPVRKQHRHSLASTSRSIISGSKLTSVSIHLLLTRRVLEVGNRVLCLIPRTNLSSPPFYTDSEGTTSRRVAVWSPWRIPPFLKLVWVLCTHRIVLATLDSFGVLNGICPELPRIKRLSVSIDRMTANL